MTGPAMFKEFQVCSRRAFGRRVALTYQDMISSGEVDELSFQASWTEQEKRPRALFTDVGRSSFQDWGSGRVLPGFRLHPQFVNRKKKIVFLLLFGYGYLGWVEITIMGLFFNYLELLSTYLNGPKLLKSRFMIE